MVQLAILMKKALLEWNDITKLWYTQLKRFQLRPLILKTLIEQDCFI